MVTKATVVPVYAEKLILKAPISFSEAFGKLGILVLLVATASMLWIIWLMCLNVAPNATANYLMNTGDFDNGDFWLILRPEPVLLVFTTLSLTIILSLYGLVVLRVTIWRNNVPYTFRVDSVVDSPIALRMQLNLTSIRGANVALTTWKDVTSFNGHHRKQ